MPRGAKGGPLLAAPTDPPTTSMTTARSDEQGIIQLVIGGRLGRDAGTALCQRVRELMGAGHARLVLCDVEGVIELDLGTVDALARLRLTAQRLGSEFCLDGASAELRELLALTGLRDVISVLDGVTPPGAAAERRVGRSGRCRGRR